MSTKILYSTTTHTENQLQNREATKVFGFWIYLMSDCVFFATLFATYIVLIHGVADGPIGKDIFELPFVFVETCFLLCSSITYGMATLAIDQDKKKWAHAWLCLTFLFGLSFLCMELYEFYHLFSEGNGPDRSAFLSGFFTLLGSHGIHVTFGLIWILVMMVQIFYYGLTVINQTRFQCLGLFWHFLDIVWICIFTIVYLIGAL